MKIKSRKREQIGKTEMSSLSVGEVFAELLCNSFAKVKLLRAPPKKLTLLASGNPVCSEVFAELLFNSFAKVKLSLPITSP